MIPTPSACNANEGESLATWEARRLRTKERVGNGNGFGTPLSIYVQMKPSSTWATPTASDGKGAGKNQHTLTLDRQVKNEEQPGGLLNPTWVEWLMGFPIDWTDPSGGPSSEDFHEWLESNRTALTAYVDAATVRFHCARPSRGNS
jgi:hypothetical protein